MIVWLLLGAFWFVILFGVGSVTYDIWRVEKEFRDNFSLDDDRILEFLRVFQYDSVRRQYYRDHDVLRDDSYMDEWVKTIWVVEEFPKGWQNVCSPTD